MKNCLEPIKVKQPAKITTLDSALHALESDSSKSVHLSPGQAAALLKHIARLKQHRDRTDVINQGLADRLSAYEAQGQSIARIWDNEIDDAYNERPNPPPFYMETE